MDRKHRFRALKPYLMHYLHGGGARHESILRDLLHQERLVSKELIQEGSPYAVGRGDEKSWEVVFGELSQILSPNQIQQLASRMLKDTREICLRLHEMAEIEKILVGEFGGEG